MTDGLDDRWCDADGVGFCVGMTLALKTEGCFNTSRIWYDAFFPFSTRLRSEFIAVLRPHIYDIRVYPEAEGAAHPSQAAKRRCRRER